MTRLPTTADEAPNWHPAESPEAQAILAEAAKRAVREPTDSFPVAVVHPPRKRSYYKPRGTPLGRPRKYAGPVYTDQGEAFADLHDAALAVCGDGTRTWNIALVVDLPGRTAYGRVWSSGHRPVGGGKQQ